MEVADSDIPGNTLDQAHEAWMTRIHSLFKPLYETVQQAFWKVVHHQVKYSHHVAILQSDSMMEIVLPEDQESMEMGGLL